MNQLGFADDSHLQQVRAKATAEDHLALERLLHFIDGNDFVLNQQ